MEPYEIAFQPSVEKDLRKLSAENCDRIIIRIEALAKEPFPAQVLNLKERKDFIAFEWAITALFMRLIQILIAFWFTIALRVRTPVFQAGDETQQQP